MSIKQILVIMPAIVLFNIVSLAQTAVNFNINDCAGTNHNLFNELDAGKVVVISFIMPCGSCIAPSLSAYNEVQNYAATYPGRVVFYLSDDNGTTACSTLNSWATTNGMAGAPVFSNTALKMSQYSSNGTGMPKIIVLAGPNHTVFFNQNNGLNVANLNNAIVQGLAATSVSENTSDDFEVKLFPNPVTANNVSMHYDLTSCTTVNVTVYNALGAKVKNIVFDKQVVGKHETQINIESLDNGIYFAKINSGENFQVIKFVIAR